jgi:antitoxin VapB
MLATAKVFTNGHSQAIRLPKAFRVDVAEMWIARNEVTGEITLKPKDAETLRQRRLDALMTAITENPLPDDFLSDASRQNTPPKNPFAGWDDPSSIKASAKATTKGTAKTKASK